MKNGFFEPDDLKNPNRVLLMAVIIILFLYIFLKS